MAIIIPNSKEYDMRMEETGNKYQQMLSRCRAYKCENHEDQEVVVDQAYQDMKGSH